MPLDLIFTSRDRKEAAQFVFVALTSHCLIRGNSNSTTSEMCGNSGPSQFGRSIPKVMPNGAAHIVPRHRFTCEGLLR